MRHVFFVISAIAVFPILTSQTERHNPASGRRSSPVDCQHSSLDLTSNYHVKVTARESGGPSQDDEPVGCCCLLKDSGPPPVWDCSGYVDGTLVTRAQCQEKAAETGFKSKWHEGKCTDKD